MRYIRFVTTALAAGALIVAAGCKSTSSYNTNGTTSSQTSASPTPSTSSSTDNGSTTSGSYNGTTSSSNVSSSSTSYNSGTSSTVQSTTPSTTTDKNGTTTTTLPDGTTVTRSETTSVVYPNGTVQTVPSNTSSTSSTTSSTAGTSSLPAIPPGAAVVTKTVTTIKTQPGTQQVSQTVPQPIYITTTPATVYAQNPPPAPMTSSTTTIYQPYRSGRGRRFPGFNLLVFADRASFSSNNSSLNGTVNTGQFGSDIRNENGWGGGLNLYLGRTNLSTEFTYSNIQPRATLTPANTAFQPITNFRFKMQPVTGTLQLHFNPRSSVDMYLGGGGAYVMFKPSNSFNAGTTGLTGVRFRDEWGPLVNAGLGFGFSPNFGLNFDAKYMWVRANATPTFGDVTIGNVGNSSRLGVNPFIVSAGLRFGF